MKILIRLPNWKGEQDKSNAEVSDLFFASKQLRSRIER